MDIVDIVVRNAEKRVAKEILSLMERVYFSDEYHDYRISYGSNGVRDLIMNTIEDRYLKE